MSIRDIVDGTTNALLNHKRYDSFGNIRSETNTAAAADVIFGYTGREFDAETGLQYNRARYYDPRLGRFISQDPSGFAGGDVNLYRYAGNNPLNATDPDGLATRLLGNVATAAGNAFGSALNWLNQSTTASTASAGLATWNSVASTATAVGASILNATLPGASIFRAAAGAGVTAGIGAAGRAAMGQTAAEESPAFSFWGRDYFWPTQSRASMNPLDNAFAMPIRQLYGEIWSLGTTGTTVPIATANEVYDEATIAATGAAINSVKGVGKGFKELGLMAADDVNSLTYVVSGHEFYRGNKSAAANALDSGSLSVSRYYGEFVANGASLGIYSQGSALLQYARGEISIDEMSERVGGTALMQLAGSRAMIQRVASPVASTNPRTITPYRDPLRPSYNNGKIHIDHAQARALGGSDVPSNLRPLAAETNLRKGGFEGQLRAYEQYLIRNKMTPADARSVIQAEIDALRVSPPPRPMDPRVLDRLPANPLDQGYPH